MISKLESEVTIPVAKYINEHPRARALEVVLEGELVRDNKNLRVSNAYVIVREAARRTVRQ